MLQPGFFDDRPCVHDVATTSPTGDVHPPIAGAFQSARHASATGAAVVVKTWAARQAAYLQVVKNAKAISDQDAAGVLQKPLASVNSGRGALNKWARKHHGVDLLIPDGYDTFELTNAVGEKEYTKRTRWTVNPNYRGPR